MPTYLQLAQEQGGNRFGPFAPGTINLGADGMKCQITLGLPGIAAVHAMIVDKGNGTYTVSPTARGLGLYLVSGGRQRLVDTSAVARAGDSIVIGDQAGPKFTLEFDSGKGNKSGIAGPVAGAAGGVAGMLGGGAAARRYEKQGGFGNAMANEVQRQAFSKLIAKTPLRDYYSLIYRARSGGLANPRFLVGVLGTVVVGLGGALVSCFGLLTAFFAANH